MKIYADKELKKQVEELDFGIVLAGETKTFEFFLHNDTVAEVDEIVPSVANAEVEILAYPKNLKAGESEKITFSWSPTLTVKKGLRALLDLKFFEIYD